MRDGHAVARAEDGEVEVEQLLRGTAGLLGVVHVLARDEAELLAREVYEQVGGEQDAPSRSSRKLCWVVPAPGVNTARKPPGSESPSV